MKVSDLRNAFEAGRPLVQKWLDIAVQMAALRDDCRTKEVDWQQVKSLLKAQIQDAAKGETKRVDAILAKADNATAYAEMLGIGLSEKNISRDEAGEGAGQSPLAAARWSTPSVSRRSEPSNIVSIAAGTVAPAERPAAPASGTEKLRQDLQASIAAEGVPDIPGFLDRRPS